MDVETSEEDGGTRITVRTDSEIALVVRSGSGERIYLPPTGQEKDTYYVEDPSSLERTSEGYTVIHLGDVRSLEVLG